MMTEIRWHGRGGQGAKTASLLLSDTPARILAAVVFISFSLRFIMVFKYGNRLTLASDDLNYIQSAVLLLEKGIFTFFNKVEPTVFVMPLYPMFLSGIFAISGPEAAGLTIVRIIQSVFGATDIVLAFAIAAWFFNRQVAASTAVVVAFYLPAITTSGYILTENLFTTLFLLLIYLSLKYAAAPIPSRFAILGAIWALAVMTRPTVAFYPAVLFTYIFLNRNRESRASRAFSSSQPARTVTALDWKLRDFIRCGAVMGLVFLIMMAPWWYRNYREYDTFIPLTAASGNPLLQGTYIGYRQEPGQTASYSEGKTTYERNRNEVEAAKKRIALIFREDFPRYLKWYTIGKTGLLWGTIFYWREYFGIHWNHVLVYHKIILLGFIGLMVCLITDFRRFFLPFAILASFNIIYCIYMAFDRYAYPLIPIMAVFLAYLAHETAKPFAAYLKPVVKRFVNDILTIKRTAYKSK